MNTIRILSLALLAGIGVAGAVWYLWGFFENMNTFRLQRIARSLEVEVDSDEDDADADQDAP